MLSFDPHDQNPAGSISTIPCCFHTLSTVEHGKCRYLPFCIIHTEDALTSREKQKERRDRITGLPDEFHAPLTSDDKRILDMPVAQLAESIREAKVTPKASVTAYGKAALLAHKETNCLTEIMIPEALEWAKDCNLDGPLAGVPISLKDVSNASIGSY